MMTVTDLIDGTSRTIEEHTFAAGYKFHDEERLAVVEFCNRTGGYYITTLDESAWLDGELTYQLNEVSEPEDTPDRELSALELQIRTIKDNLATATLLGDDEWIAELKVQYSELVNG